jgi:hypothetical protein
MEEKTIESTLRAWVRDHSGLSEAQVVWAEQASVRLATPFITLRLGDLARVGGLDEVRQAYDENAAAGQEVSLTVVGRRELTLSIQCFGEACDSPRAILSRVQTALSLETVMAAFEEVGISCFDEGTIRNVTLLQETDFEQRALLETRFYVAEEVSETTTYIETTEVTNEDTDVTFTIG